MKTASLSLAAILLTVPAAGQDLNVSGGIDRKQAMARHVPDGAIRLDGRLDDEAWLQAEPLTDFIQKEPTEGALPTDPMEVRFVYDDGGLYIGARMYDRSGGSAAPLGRRDEGDQAEHFIVSFDTFLDRRTAYAFGVTAAGVRLDRFYPGDNEDVFDLGFDPVWEARASRQQDGWSAELRIPFSQLRFNAVTDQVWGLNVRRFRPTLEEEDYWVLVPRTERAWTSRFGELRGISSVRPSRRLELLPYVAQGSSISANRDRANPFDNGWNPATRVGGDLKMGIGPNLTLDATVRPDFGQVEADPAEVNLTAFATRFAERRPFFTEGARLLTLSGHPNAFYSRRIGAPPVRQVSGEFVDYPKDTTILAAGKITGRLSGGTSIGILSAVTNEEFARVADADSPQVTKTRVAPRTMVNLAKVQREFGRSGSTASALVGTMYRDMPAGDPLAEILSRKAVVFGTDALLRFKGGQYELNHATVGSYVSGDKKAIEVIQRNSTHYMQRPDKQYARIDPSRTSLKGFTSITSFTRTGGRHWLFSGSARFDTPGVDYNDIGQINDADGIQPGGSITYRQTRPGRVFRNYSFRVNQSNEWTTGGDRQGGALGHTLNLTWRNFWTTAFTVSRTFQARDAALTRGGPLMGRPRGWSANATLANSATSTTRWSGTVSATENKLGGMTRRINGSFSFRPAPRWQLSLAPLFDRVVEAQQYVSTLAGGRPETFGSRYVFAYIDRSTISTTWRMGLTLKPDLNLDVYAEPFAASGRYYNYGELLAPASLERLDYGTSGTTLEIEPDGSQIVKIGDAVLALKNRSFNTLSFRSNVVLRWEWRPGSTLHVVWQQDRSQSAVIGDHVSAGDMFRSLSAPGRNVFALKMSFWVPVH